jgi:hypothetical protein
MNLKHSSAALGVAALVAFPAGAMAKNGNEHGGNGKNAHAIAEHGQSGAKHGNAKKPKLKTYEFKGVVAVVGDGSLQVAISGGNSRGRKFKGQTLTFDLASAKLRVADVNNDGKRDLADVAAGDRLNVQAKLAAVDASQPLAARVVVDKAVPAAPVTDQPADDQPAEEGPAETPAAA